MRKLTEFSTCVFFPQVQEKNQLQAVIQMLEAQQLADPTATTGEGSSAPDTVRIVSSVVANSGMVDHVEVRRAHANLKELRERHALQVSFVFEQPVGDTSLSGMRAMVFRVSRRR